MWKQWSTKTLVLLFGMLAVRIKSDPFGVIISKTRKVSLLNGGSQVEMLCNCKYQSTVIGFSAFCFTFVGKLSFLVCLSAACQSLFRSLFRFNLRRR